jgi:hypothetical protein
MTSQQSVEEYLSLTSSWSSLNRDHLSQIRTVHETISQEDNKNQLSQQTLRTLAQRFNLVNDQINLDYLKCCVENQNEDAAAMDLVRKWTDIQADNNRPVRRKVPDTSNSSRQLAQENITVAAAAVPAQVELVCEAVCMIYVKRTASPVDTFIQEFFFQQPTKPTQNTSKYVHFCVVST